MDVEEFKRLISDPLSRELGDDFKPVVEMCFRQSVMMSDELRRLNDMTTNEILGREYTSNIEFKTELSRMLDAMRRADEAERKVIMHHFELRGVFFKAVYQFWYDFLCRFVGALHQRSWMTPNSLIKHGRKELECLTSDELLGMYVTSAYRDKLVAHHSVLRAEGGGLTRHGYFQIRSDAKENALSSDELSRLEQLYEKYGDPLESKKYPKMKAADLSGVIFHSVPVGKIRSKSQDRIDADLIAEKAGCRSKGVDQIQKDVEVFCLGTVRCLT